MCEKEHTIKSYRDALEHWLVGLDPAWKMQLLAQNYDTPSYDILGLLYGLARYTVTEEDVTIHLVDGTIVIPRWSTDEQLYNFKLTNDYYDHSFAIDDMRMDGIEPVFDYTTLPRYAELPEVEEEEDVVFDTASDFSNCMSTRSGSTEFEDGTYHPDNDHDFESDDSENDELCGPLAEVPEVCRSYVLAYQGKAYSDVSKRKLESLEKSNNLKRQRIQYHDNVLPEFPQDICDQAYVGFGDNPFDPEYNQDQLGPTLLSREMMDKVIHSIPTVTTVPLNVRPDYDVKTDMFMYLLGLSHRMKDTRELVKMSENVTKITVGMRLITYRDDVQGFKVNHFRPLRRFKRHVNAYMLYDGHLIHPDKQSKTASKTIEKMLYDNHVITNAVIIIRWKTEMALIKICCLTGMARAQQSEKAFQGLAQFITSSPLDLPSKLKVVMEMLHSLCVSHELTTLGRRKILITDLRVLSDVERLAEKMFQAVYVIRICTSGYYASAQVTAMFRERGSTGSYVDTCNQSAYSIQALPMKLLTKSAVRYRYSSPTLQVEFSYKKQAVRNIRADMLKHRVKKVK